MEIERFGWFCVLMQRLYELGARKVIVTGTGPMGCVPAELAQRSRTGECAVELQRAAALFNPQLASMISSVNNEIGSDVFMAANTFEMHMDFVSNPQAFGESQSHLILYFFTFKKKNKLIIYCVIK